MGYNFKLEKVLNYKENIESVKKGEYGETSNKLEKAKNKLMKYKNNKSNLIDQKNTMNTNIGNLKIYGEYIKSINDDIKKQEELISEINRELKIRQEELMIAMQEKKTLEKLKEKDYDEFVKEANKDEEKVIDELNSFNNSKQE